MFTFRIISHEVFSLYNSFSSTTTTTAITPHTQTQISQLYTQRQYPKMSNVLTSTGDNQITHASVYIHSERMFFIIMSIVIISNSNKNRFSKELFLTVVQLLKQHQKTSKVLTIKLQHMFKFLLVANGCRIPCNRIINQFQNFAIILNRCTLAEMSTLFKL